MPKGGFIGPGSYQNDIETDRNLIRSLTDARSGALSGFTISPHASLLRMVVAAGAAVVAAKTADARRGSYYAWNDTTEEVQFTTADATNPRIDALVLAFGDSQYGSLGSGVVDGPQWLVVNGTPAASPAAPSDATIDAAVGAGSWVRWADVRINVGNTTIQSGNITRFNPAAGLLRARMTRTTDHTHTSGVSPNWTTTDYDVGGLADLTNDRFNITVSGVYRVTANLSWGPPGVSPSPNERRGAYIRVNGAEVARQEIHMNTNIGVGVVVSWEGSLTAGDQVTVTDSYVTAAAGSLVYEGSAKPVWVSIAEVR